MDFKNELANVEQQAEARKKTMFDELKKDNLPTPVEQKRDEKAELVNDMFKAAIVSEVKNNEDLQVQVIDTAKKYTETKMETIKNDVDTEYKEAVYNNNEDACLAYGFNEKTTPTWAIRMMKFGYSIMLAIYVFLASFTVMPIIFLVKKISVGLRHTWIAVLFAILIYLGVVFVPIIIGLTQGH